MLEWLDSHGIVFLNKNTAVGKSLQKARALHKNYEHFETVAQVRTVILLVLVEVTGKNCYLTSPVDEVTGKNCFAASG